MISYDNKTLLKDGKPWMPTMGEIHYSRVDHRRWKDLIYKMKAGGIDIVSSYVFWIHHEEVEGHFHTEGNLNLRKFLRLVKEAGLYMFLRIGPWAHGECRGGGMPDWMCEKDFQTRTNDPRYLAYVETYFKNVWEQAKGYLYSDGGPIIGMQIENEFGSCVMPFEPEEMERHIYILKDMLKNIGFDVPIYTATGWGNSHTGDCIPVWGGYCDAPWEKGTHPTAPNDNYIFTPNLNDASIGSDAGRHEGFSTVEGKFPYLTAELGGGMQCTHHRRPIATDTDLGAISTCKLGSGANLLGYYMYCGGKHPTGLYTSMNEYYSAEMTARFRAGYYCDVPELDYDFQAPVSTCGWIKPSYKELRLLSMFLRDFGDVFSPMTTYFPQDNPGDPTDMESLRYTVRRSGNQGFLFLNNYQRRYEMTEKRLPELSFQAESEPVTFRDIALKDRDYHIYPFNLPIGNALLKTAKAQLLCRLNEKTFVFFADGDPDYEIEGDLGDFEILTITREDARNACKITLDKDYLFIAEGLVYETDKGVEIVSTGKPQFKVYPDCGATFTKTGTEGKFTVYEKEIPLTPVTATYTQAENTAQIALSYTSKNLSDAILNLGYIGDTGEVYCDGEKIMDQFCNGTPLQINLSDLDLPESLTLKILPLEESVPVYMEMPVTYTQGKAGYVREITVDVLYRNIIM